jgi:hypothetical protein
VKRYGKCGRKVDWIVNTSGSAPAYYSRAHEFTPSFNGYFCCSIFRFMCSQEITETLLKVAINTINQTK